MILRDKTTYVEGFSKALIGSTEDGKAVYIKDAMVAILLEEGLTYEEAVDFLDYNVFSAHVGDYTPIFIDGLNRDHFTPQD
jgi:hypothetical protein